VSNLRIDEARQEMALKLSYNFDVKMDKHGNANIKAQGAEGYMEDFVSIWTLGEAFARLKVDEANSYKDHKTWNTIMRAYVENVGWTGIINVDLWCKPVTGIRQGHMPHLMELVTWLSTEYNLGVVLSWGQDDGGYSLMLGANIFIQAYMGSHGFVSLSGDYGPETFDGHFISMYQAEEV